MSVNLDQGLQIYIAEAHDLLKSMEDSLLRLENDPSDAEAIGSIFRAAHTIKGSAGIFNLDAIVKFTHNVEDVLDRVRDGEVAVDPLLIAVLLECGDHMLELIDVVAAQGEQLDEAALVRESDLLKRLQTYQVHDHSREDTVREAGVTCSGNWHISLRFGLGVLKDGMDPLSFIRYLSKLGDIVSVVPLFDSMPEASDMDAQSCYLGFEIELKSDLQKVTIVNVFEFVSESSQIHVLPPHSKLADYVALIQALPEDDMRVGEILVRTGALTEQELAHALKDQSTFKKEDGSPEPLGTFLVKQGSVKQELVGAAPMPFA